MLVIRAAWIAIQAGLFLYGLLLSGCLLARVVIGERWRLVAFANNSLPWPILAGLAASPLMLLSPYRLVLIGLQLPGLVALGVWYGAALRPRAPDQVRRARHELRVATFNLSE